MTGLLFFLKCLGEHPAISVSHLTVFEAYGVQHAIAVVGVITPVWRVIGVGAISHIQTIQVCGDLANDLHFREHIFAVDGAVVFVQRWNIVNRQVIEVHEMGLHLICVRTRSDSLS